MKIYYTKILKFKSHTDTHKTSHTLGEVIYNTYTDKTLKTGTFAK